ADFPNGSSAQVTQKPASSGVNDNTVYLTKNAGGVFINGGTRVVTADVAASNGIIHAIDNVLLPPTQTIAGIVSANASANPPQFTQLLRALQRPAAAALLTAATTAGSNVTVFAPTDAAFQALLTALTLNNIDQVPDATLVSVLQLHIVNNARAFSSDLTNNQTVATLGGNVTVGVNGATVTVRGPGNGMTAATVSSANVLATNGVVHIIDRVLLPNLPTGPGNIVQVASGNADFSILVAAVAKTNLVTTLSGTGPFTVLAPTNAAFAKLAGTALDAFSTVDKINAVTNTAQIDALRSVLLYHVLAGRSAAADFPNGSSAQVTQKPASAAGVNDNTVYLTKNSGGVFINGGTRVVTADVAASNGIIHAIDNVLLPPTQTIAAIVAASATGAQPQFTQLLRALQRPAAAALLTAASAPGSNLTVFAPTDAAFQALLTALTLNNIDQVPDATLLNVLRLHIVNARAFSSDLTNNQAIPTLGGANVTVGINGATVTVRGTGNGTTGATVTAANVLATNGVVHVIDRVLLP
ncbi:MAG TPA: fasciclin domain-containing protein, partial [Hymenobacter sp.]|nr:fasciclin domain-containing protein [Hymenobacter sp.]